MAKPRSIFVCRACGAAHHRWMGKCPDCDGWDTLEQSTLDASVARDPQLGDAVLSADAAPAAVAMSETPTGQALAQRWQCGISEFDRVLGGGLVPGSAVLFGGEPGIGKSTLLMQAAGGWSVNGQRVLYVSSEESAEQVKLRAARLHGIRVETAKDFFLLADTNLARILEQARRVNPRVLLLDSIQMIYRSDLPGAPGSVTQLRRCAAELVAFAKLSGTAVVLVGHVTKDGTLAGPRLLEHLVDAVLTFEGDRYHSHRIVRAVKNRFGTTMELGLFEMTGEGLREVRDGGGVAASEGAGTPRPGSIVCPLLTGTRCMLVEIQALTATGFPGVAKRKSSGLDSNRLAMLIAVLEQHAGLRLADRDVFASAVGGVRAVEPASDLAILLAIAGAQHRRAVAPFTVAVGEVGLGGEVRQVPQLEPRIRESARLGYMRAVVPNAPNVRIPGIEIVSVATVNQAIEELG